MTHQESRLAKFFDISGGVAGMGAALAGVIVLIAAPSYEKKLIAVVFGIGIVLFGTVAGFGRKWHKTRIVIGIVFVAFTILSVAALFFLPPLR